MYEDKYYGSYFTMTTPDNKSISEMDYSELYWTAKNLDHYADSVRDKIKERYEVLRDESREEKLRKLADKYLDIIEAGVGRKCKKNHWKAYDILLNIYFGKTDD